MAGFLASNNQPILDDYVQMLILFCETKRNIWEREKKCLLTKTQFKTTLTMCLEQETIKAGSNS